MTRLRSVVAGLVMIGGLVVFTSGMAAASGLRRFDCERQVCTKGTCSATGWFCTCECTTDGRPACECWFT
jgi:hypothetical protein